MLGGRRVAFEDFVGTELPLFCFLDLVVTGFPSDAIPAFDLAKIALLSKRSDGVGELVLGFEDVLTECKKRFGGASGIAWFSLCDFDRKMPRKPAL